MTGSFLAAVPPEPDPVRFALGIDPGPSTGITVLDLRTRLLAVRAITLQCNGDAAGQLLRWILDANTARGTLMRGGIEAFAPGRGAGSLGKGGRATRDQVNDLAGICASYGVPLRARYAALVKPWADGNGCKRLRESGLYQITAKSPDARSAAGQALYCAVFDCSYPDPLSARAAVR